MILFDWYITHFFYVWKELKVVVTRIIRVGGSQFENDHPKETLAYELLRKIIVNKYLKGRASSM